MDANDVHSVWPKVGKAAPWTNVDYNCSTAEIGYHEGVYTLLASIVCEK